MAKGMERPLARVAELISKDLRTFGYPDCTDLMVKETWWAMKRKEKTMPHGIIGMFAQSKIQEALDVGMTITDDSEPAKAAAPVAAPAKKLMKKKS